MQVLSICRKTWWLRISKTSNKEEIRCPGGFLEEIKAIGVEKMHQILTEIDKNTNKIKILNNLCNFCVIFECLGGLELQRHSTRNKLIVRKAFLRKKRSF